MNCFIFNLTFTKNINKIIWPHDQIVTQNKLSPLFIVSVILIDLLIVGVT